MRRFLLTCPVVLAAVASCVPSEWATYRESLPPDQRAYMEKVDNLGPSARVSETDVDAGWKRAEGFLTRFAGGFEKDPSRSQRIKSKGGAYAYTIDVRKGITDLEFSVMCTHSGKGSTEEAWRNARIAQHHIATGELPFPDLVSR